MTHSNQNQSTLTSHIFKHQQEERQIMKNFRFKFPEAQLPTPHRPTPHRPIQEHKSFIKTPETKQPISSSHQQIDNKASIVNGKLILFQGDQKDLVRNGRQFMRLLKENNISYKEYMLGNKQEYHKQIAARQKQKEEELIKDYIDKHIKMNKTTKIQVIEEKEQSSSY